MEVRFDASNTEKSSRSTSPLRGCLIEAPKPEGSEGNSLNKSKARSILSTRSSVSENEIEDNDSIMEESCSTIESPSSHRPQIKSTASSEAEGSSVFQSPSPAANPSAELTSPDEDARMEALILDQDMTLDELDAAGECHITDCSATIDHSQHYLPFLDALIAYLPENAPSLTSIELSNLYST